MKTKPEIHKKGWGEERWYHNDEKYCGKMLVFEAGKKCSWHYHLRKTETFALIKGKMLITWLDGSDDISKANVLTLEVGDVFEVPVGRRHQMYAFQDSELMEFSTQHFEEDSIRVIKGD